jgi:hypothetical protein
MAVARPTIEIEQTQELDKLVGAWYNAAQQLVAIKEAEAEARDALFSYFYKSDDPKRSQAGTEKFGMPGGWALEVERRINWKVDEAALDACKKTIAELKVDESGELPSIDACIKYKPTFSESGYKTLRDDVRLILSDALESKPGQPAISLIAPKAEAKPKPKNANGGN